VTAHPAVCGRRVEALPGAQVAGDDHRAQRLDGVLLGGGERRGGSAHRNAWMPVSAPPTTSACTSAVPS